MERKKREQYLQIRLSNEERELLEKKCISSNCNSKSQLMRKLLIDRAVIRLDEERLNQIYRCIASAASNINQIAVRVNSTGNFYQEDLAELQKGVELLLQQQRYFRSELLKLKR